MWGYISFAITSKSLATTTYFTYYFFYVRTVFQNEFYRKMHSIPAVGTSNDH